MDTDAIAETDASEVARRIRNILSGVALDCACRERIDAALDRFADIEAERVARRELVEARHQRKRIQALLRLLNEVEIVTAHEADRGVFAELALLFEDVAVSAHAGAHAMRRLAEAGERHRRDPDTDLT